MLKNNLSFIFNSLFIVFISILIVCCEGGGNNSDPKIPTDNIPPSEVSNLTIISDNTFVTLSWQNPNDNVFSHVEIWYGANSSSNTRYIDQIDSTGTIIDNLTNKMSYTFLIITVDVNNNKSAGIKSVITPVDNSVPNLTAYDLYNKSNFGYSVAISGDYAIVGSPKNSYDDANNWGISVWSSIYL